MRPKRATPDRVIARIAGRQYGVVTIAQLLAAGIGYRGASRRASAGRLHRLHRGVYAVGHPWLSDEGRWLAAVLACGDGAVLSHRAAGALWGLVATGAGPVDVTVPGRGGRRKRRGIRIHRSRLLSPAASTFHRGIVVTTPMRTVADLRPVLASWELNRAIREAEVLGLDVGDAAGEKDLTRSQLEERFLRLCRRHRLPRPEVNSQVGAFEVDFVWPGRSLIVETDGYRYHRGRMAFENDRARDLELKLLGYDVVRFTYRQVANEPARVARTLRALL